VASERRPGDPEDFRDTPDAAKDKPGPKRRKIAGGKLRLPRRRPLREGVLTAFSRILASARRCARSAEEDPVAAVHEYRKSIRRARAVVSLLRPSVGKSAADGLARHLKDAFQGTGAVRDADILLTSLRAIPAEPEDDLARHAIEVALELEQRLSRREISETLGQGVPNLAPLPAALEVTLSPDFSANDLERGLSRSRRRERRALERARETGSDEELHEWRKRVKELRYQVELFASTGSRELKKREKALGDLAQQLGEVTDAIVLAREILRREKDGSVPPASSLLERIRGSASSASRGLLEKGADLFERDPKSFARQVIAERG
jgi:CHAD domain-containing protein